MKFSLSPVTVLLATTVSVLGHRLPIGARGLPNLPAGAVYWSTNEASGNNLMVANILPNGTLQYTGAYSTKGLGLHGTTDPITNPDGLFSQGAVTVNKQKSILTVVNSGSDTVSMFSINPLSPSKLSLIGSPVKTSGDFPNSVAINKAGTIAYVLHTGAKNGVEMMKIKPISGLSVVPNSFRNLGLNQTVLPSGPPGTASDVFYNANESKLIVSVKAIEPESGYLAIWDVLPNGQLSTSFNKITAPSGSTLVWGAQLIPGHNAVFASDGSVGANIFDLDKGTSTAFNVPGQVLSCWTVFSSKTGNFYTSDPATNLITEIHVDNSLTASMVAQHQLAANALILDMTIASVGGKDYLYILEPGLRSLQAVSLTGSGQANIIQSLDLATVAPNVPTGVSLQGISSYSCL